MTVYSISDTKLPDLLWAGCVSKLHSTYLYDARSSSSSMVIDANTAARSSYEYMFFW